MGKNPRGKLLYVSGLGQYIEYLTAGAILKSLVTSICLESLRGSTSRPFRAAGVEQQRLIVFHQKIVKPQIVPLSKDRDAVDTQRDFRCDGHASLLNRTFLTAFLF
jgi:hypothetical protein